MGPASAQRGQMGPNMGPRGYQRPPYGPASAPNRFNTGHRPGNTHVPPRGQTPLTISQQNSNKTFIKGGVQFQRNSVQASQTGGVNSMCKESHINSRQRLGGALHEQKIHMKHTVNQDASSGAGQDTRVTSNIQKTVTKDGRQVIRKVKKIVTTNIEAEE
uniref:Uncharacterized protein n=1 Tax=Cacopsylla melanoneura TaxID=428564 RepID=A0A8D8QI47_9HEMI